MEVDLKDRAGYPAPQPTEESRSSRESALSKTLRILAHDTGGMIGAAQMALDWLADHRASDFDDRDRNSLATAREQLLFLSAILRSLSSASKLETGDLRAEPVDCQIDQLMNRQMDSLRPIAERLKLGLEIRSESCFARGDPAMLATVMWLCIAHVIRFAPRDKVVRVVLRPEVRDIFFAAADFDLTTLKPASDGNEALRAIELLFCERAIAAHGGSFGGLVKPGQGRAIWFRLPRRETEMETRK